MERITLRPAVQDYVELADGGVVRVVMLHGGIEIHDRPTRYIVVTDDFQTVRVVRAPDLDTSACHGWKEIQE